jgi:uncharacterized protein YyaL (SSP411 family)
MTYSMPEATFRFSPRPNQAHQIAWRPYGVEAFSEAREQGKLILLSISAVWCHWCHVMDETTYSDPTIIQRINQQFIPIRVDSDQRPDINQRYNMGGWPTLAVLSPEGETLTGGTYIPPEQLLPLFDQVIQYWAEHQGELQQKLTPPAALKLDPAAPTPQEATVAQILDTIRQQFDRAYGGIGVAPKFPHFDVWELCLARFAASGGQDGWAAGMVVRTLDAMAGSNLYDPAGGGFFRYSTTREWTIPHFEKILEDNALMVKLYLRAYQILGDESYRQVADAVLTWSNRTLLTADGLWGGSQDADEAYYQLPPEEREKAPAPHIDPVIHTNWNAQMISAQLLGAALINPGAYTAVALTALEALWDRMWDDELGLFHYADREAKLPGLLTDLVAMTNVLIDAFEFNGDPIFLERAHLLVDFADRHLAGPHCFYDQPDSHEAAGRLQHRQTPLPDNVQMARALWRLGAIEDDERLRLRAQALLGTFTQVAQENGVFGAGWALVADQTLAPLFEANVVESSHHSGNQLRQAIYGVYDRNRAIRTLRIGTSAFDESQFPEVPLPALYLCRGQTCSAPVTEPDGILAALQQLAGIAVEPPATEDEDE